MRTKPGEPPTAVLALEESATALAILAQVRFAQAWDFAGAEDEFRHALTIDPKNARARFEADALRGMHLFILARLDQRSAAGGRVSPIDRAAYHAWSSTCTRCLS